MTPPVTEHGVYRSAGVYILSHGLIESGGQLCLVSATLMKPQCGVCDCDILQPRVLGQGSRTLVCSRELVMERTVTLVLRVRVESQGGPHSSKRNVCR
jgi:hypothetical protein